MNKHLFREKSIERVSSPDQLNDYIRVTSPGVWMVLVGVILILVGICGWGMFGRLDTTISVAGITQDSASSCYVRQSEREEITVGMPVRVGDAEFVIDDIAVQPVQADDSFPEYLCYLGGIASGEWVYEVSLDKPVGGEGTIFEADIVIESISPMSFVVN